MANGGIIGPPNPVCTKCQAEVIHTITSSGCITLQPETTSIDYVVVAGGAGGESGHAWNVCRRW